MKKKKPIITYIKNGKMKRVRINSWNEEFVMGEISKSNFCFEFQEDVTLIRFENFSFETNTIFNCWNQNTSIYFDHCIFSTYRFIGISHCDSVSIVDPCFQTNSGLRLSVHDVNKFKMKLDNHFILDGDIDLYLQAVDSVYLDASKNTLGSIYSNGVCRPDVVLKNLSRVGDLIIRANRLCIQNSDIYSRTVLPVQLDANKLVLLDSNVTISDYSSIDIKALDIKADMNSYLKSFSYYGSIQINGNYYGNKRLSDGSIKLDLSLLLENSILTKRTELISVLKTLKEKIDQEIEVQSQGNSDLVLSGISKAEQQLRSEIEQKQMELEGLQKSAHTRIKKHESRLKNQAINHYMN